MRYFIIFIFVFICMKGVISGDNNSVPGSNSTGELDPTTVSGNSTANETTPVAIISSTIATVSPVPASPETSPVTNASTAIPPVVTGATLASTESSSPLPSPEETPTTPIKISNHQFHAPSFIGGIVLALGLMAISYVGFKYYKSRTGRNYHTLQENLHM